MLADRLDVTGFTESASSDGRKITSRLTLTCPDPTASLAEGPDAPLGWMGQRLIGRAGFTHRDRSLTVPLGQWRIDRPDPDAPTWTPYSDAMMVRRGGQVQVDASDLLSLLEDDLPVLTGPLPGGTIQSEVVRLVAGRLPVASEWPVSAQKRAPAQVYADNRLTAICDLLATVGAAAWVNRAGALEPRPLERAGLDWVIPTAAVEQARLLGGREGLFNVAIVTGTDDDGNELREVAQETRGQFSVHGTFGVVTRTFNNPLGKTRSALRLTAETYLRQGVEGRAARCEIRLTTPNWAVDVLDRVQLTLPDGTVVAGPVVALERSPDTMSIEVPVNIYAGGVN